MTLRELQEEQKVWVKHNFLEDGQDNYRPSISYQPLLGAVEEIGELCHAHLKQIQGIRGTKVEHLAAKVDAVGDTIIFLADYCSAEGIDLEDAVTITWNRVKKRDWKKDKVNG